MAAVSDPSGDIHLPGLGSALGFVFEAVGADEVRASLEVGPEHKQPAGVVHGGVYAALAESVAGAGTHSAVSADGKVALGLSNSTSFVRPVMEGRIHAVGRPVHRGRTTWIWDVEITNDDGKPCALSRVTLVVR